MGYHVLKPQQLLELLSELNWHGAVEVSSLSDECYLVRVHEQHWKFWPCLGSWIEVCSAGETIGEMHHGSVLDFREKIVHKNSFLPRNHSKKWTKSEKDLLNELIHLDRTIPDIANILGRSRRSIVAKSAVLLGVNLDHVIVKEKFLSQTIKVLIQEIKAESDKIAAKLEN